MIFKVLLDHILELLIRVCDFALGNDYVLVITERYIIKRPDALYKSVIIKLCRIIAARSDSVCFLDDDPYYTEYDKTDKRNSDHDPDYLPYKVLSLFPGNACCALFSFLFTLADR